MTQSATGTKMRVLAAMLAVSMLGSACAQERSMQLRCELSIATTLSASQKAELRFTLINAGKRPVQVLNWQTPFEGIAAPMFTVKRDGVEVDYHGAMVKRGAPARESYLELQPGERREVAVDLAAGWDVAVPGTYTVEYAGELFDVVDGTARQRKLDEFTPLALRCPAVSFERNSP
jgi:hypothetical protein